MARLPTAAISPVAGAITPLKAQSEELRSLLLHLRQSILYPDPSRERRLRTSEYERARLSFNLEHARTRLTRLEQDALLIKGHNSRQEIQTDLNQQRELLEQLLDRMKDLAQLAADNQDDDSSDGEDVLADIIPTPSESTQSRSSVAETTLPQPEADESSSSVIPEPQEPTLNVPATSTTQDLRSRKPASSSLQPAAELEMDTSHATARAALFGSRRSNKSPAPSSIGGVAAVEAVEDRSRAEQEALSESILAMAGRLKASSQGFSRTLEMDRESLARAGETMDKAETGMDFASRRMGALRRATEGKGWWGRMILFAWVYGTMVALLLVVFILPKLRF